MLWAGLSSAGTMEPHEQPGGFPCCSSGFQLVPWWPSLLMCSQTRAGVPSSPTQLLPTLAEGTGRSTGRQQVHNIVEVPPWARAAAESQPREGQRWGMEKFHLRWKSCASALLALEYLPPCWVRKDTQLWEEIPWVMPSVPEGSCPAHPWAGPWLIRDPPWDPQVGWEQVLPTAGTILGAGNTFLCWCSLLGSQTGHSFLFLLSTSGLN